MGKDEEAMFKQELDNLKADHGPRLDALEREHKEFKLQMEGLKFDNAQVKTGLAEVSGTVSSMGRDVKNLSDTVSTDGAETRSMLKTAFEHVMAGNEKRSEFKFSQLEAKTKVTLGVIAVLGGGGMWAGIAGLIAVL